MGKFSRFLKNSLGRGKELRLGIALGGGGARGLAHIPLLEALDSRGVRPCCIAGTSIGAVIGALYASGMSGSEIRELADNTVFQKDDSLKNILDDIHRLGKLMDLNFMGSGIFHGDAITDYLCRALPVKTFDELNIPLIMTATDFWTSEKITISQGELASAMKASMGLPGIFKPVKRDGMILIDGGGVDPVPYDLLKNCTVTVAIDVLGRSEPKEENAPSSVRAVLEMFNIMQRSIVRTTMERNRPDIYIRPDIPNVGLMEFHRAKEIFEMGERAVPELLEKLQPFLPEKGGKDR